MKIVLMVLVVALAALQYRLWMGEGSLAQLTHLKAEIEKQKAENAILVEKNRVLSAEVDALRNDIDAIEEKARLDMGMVKEGETFFMFVEELNSSRKK